MNLKHIYKIITNEELQEAKLLNIYSGSIKDIQDGFIHFSAEEQIKETLNRHYPNKENLILLKVNAFKLEHLLWEQASNGDMYPHLYSKLDIKNVEDEFELKLDENRNHKLPKQFK